MIPLERPGRFRALCGAVAILAGLGLGLATPTTEPPTTPNRNQPMPTVQTIADVVASKIRGQLAAQRIRQEDLASALGLHQTSVSARLSGRTPWTLVEVIDVAAFFGVPLSELVPDSIVGATP